MMRKIGSKFHIEDGEIIKTSNGQPIPRDEPLFLLRARDYLALPLLLHFRELSLADSCTDYHVTGLTDVIAKFQAFAREHPERMKQPGCTRGL